MRRTLIVAAALALVGAGAACGTGDDPALQPPPQDTPTEGPSTPVADPDATAELSEFEITVEPASVPAGEVVLAAENTGQIDHEFWVIRTALAPDALPTSENRVDVESDELELVGGLEEVNPGEVEVLSVDLAGGSYVLICNIPSHYANGMRASFTVS